MTHLTARPFTDKGEMEFPMFLALRLLTLNIIQLLSLLRVLDSSLPSVSILAALHNYIIRNYGSCITSFRWYYTS